MKMTGKNRKSILISVVDFAETWKKSSLTKFDEMELEQIGKERRPYL